MTNWMTATGIALIAGGLATLICFRRVLWAGQGRGRPGTERRAARTRAIEARRRPELEPGRAVLPVQAAAPEISGAHFTAETGAPAGSRGTRRRGRSGRSGLGAADLRAAGGERAGGERAGLASIGLADEDPDVSEVVPEEVAPEEVVPEEEAQPLGDVDASHGDGRDAETSVPVMDRRCDADFGPPTGDYWMPVPESAYANLDAAGHGWPVGSERDPAAESEPTAVVPTWPPARPFDRIELPRTWSETPGRRTPARRWDEADRHDGRRHWGQLDRDGHDGWRRGFGPEEEHLTVRGAEPRRRPRPRPNPTVYVSRHAAE